MQHPLQHYKSQRLLGQQCLLVIPLETQPNPHTLHVGHAS
ncbi:hypothetical protein ID866_10393 [Astraeus odoratus]|nr:hypothetical protein ID866_10393 [Astraeus odoratus]